MPKPAKPRYPVMWLTYKRRVQDDVETLYKQKGGPEFFDDKYVEALTKTAEQLEARQLKLLIYSIAISGFMVLSLISSDASVTIFGISIKDAPGVKELLLILSATVAALAFLVTQSKELRIAILEKQAELKYDKPYAGLSKVGAKASFDFTVYIAKQYDKWIFAPLIGRLITGLTVLLLIATAVFFFIFSFALWIYVILQLRQAPTLGLWSHAAVVYSVLAYAFAILGQIRISIPFRYKDMRKLKELETLEQTDPVRAEELRTALFGSK